MEFDTQLVKKRFSKQAQNYHQLNIVQKNVASDLIRSIGSNPKKVLDLGAGSGAVYSAIDWDLERFIAVDFSNEMCEIHPKGANIEIVNADFNSPADMQNLTKYRPLDLIISSSALQWSVDLAQTLDLIKALEADIAIALFCDKTFQDLREFANLRSNLPSQKKASDLITSRFDVEIFMREYEINFNSARELFSYINKSGVGGGFKKVAFSKARNLLECYPHCTLRFEALFAISKKLYIYCK